MELTFLFSFSSLVAFPPLDSVKGNLRSFQGSLVYYLFYFLLYDTHLCKRNPNYRWPNKGHYSFYLLFIVSHILSFSTYPILSDSNPPLSMNLYQGFCLLKGSFPLLLSPSACLCCNCSQLLSLHNWISECGIDLPYMEQLWLWFGAI